MGRYDDNFKDFQRGYVSTGGGIGREQREDVRDFFESNEDDLELCEKSGLTWHRLGEDFYLTRNRHGGGYCDEKSRGREVDAALDRLTKAAHVYGSTESDEV